MNDGSFVHPNIVKEKDRELEITRYLLKEATTALKNYRERVEELELQVRSYKAQADYVKHSDD